MIVLIQQGLHTESLNVSIASCAAASVGHGGNVLQAEVTTRRDQRSLCRNLLSGYQRLAASSDADHLK
mgnify:CR=1 FL=1